MQVTTKNWRGDMNVDGDCDALRPVYFGPTSLHDDEHCQKGGLDAVYEE